MNEFIELLRTSNGYCEKNVRFEPLVLDNTIHTIMDNGILTMGLKWGAPISDYEKQEYVEWGYIMKRALEHHKKHPDNFRISLYQPSTTYNDNSKEHRNVVFADKLEVIENTVF